MVTRLKQMQGLAQLADAGLRAAQAKLAAILRAQEEIRAQMAALRAEKSVRAEEGTEGGDADAAFRGGADFRWHRWIDSRRAALNAELARLMVAEQEARSELGHAFGRSEATKSLAARSRAEQVARAEARAERQTPH